MISSTYSKPTTSRILTNASSAPSLCVFGCVPKIYVLSRFPAYNLFKNSFGFIGETKRERFYLLVCAQMPVMKPGAVNSIQVSLWVLGAWSLWPCLLLSRLGQRLQCRAPCWTKPEQSVSLIAHTTVQCCPWKSSCCVQYPQPCSSSIAMSPSLLVPDLLFFSWMNHLYPCHWRLDFFEIARVMMSCCIYFLCLPYFTKPVFSSFIHIEKLAAFLNSVISLCVHKPQCFHLFFHL